MPIGRGAIAGLVLLGQLLLFSSALAARSYDLKSEINGERRVAKVFEGGFRQTEGRPMVFAFHGYGDNRIDFSRFVDLHKSWPEAIIVYPEGLKLPDAEGKLRSRGWQTRIGSLNDRDLDYVDFLLEELGRRYSIDRRRIYATGFSNGAWFVFLLMGQRQNIFSAFAPVGSAVTGAVLDKMTDPQPVIYVIGKDEGPGILKAAQLTVEAISRANRSSSEQYAWAENYILFEPEEGGAAFVFNLHRGGHIWPYGASDLIVRFFQENRSPDEE